MPETHQFHAAFNAHAERRKVLRHQAFGDGLIEEQQIRIPRLQGIKVEPREALAIRIEVRDTRPMTEFEKRFNQPMLLEEFKRTCLDADGA